MAYDIIIGRDEEDKKKFGKDGLILLGKSYVRMGNLLSLSNNIYLDIARSHVILVSGKRGSGKSYSLSVIAEGISSQPKEIRDNLSVLIFDTMGVFWTMKHENEKDKDLLEKWGLVPQSIDLDIYTPQGHFEEYKDKGIPTDYPFSIQPRELTSLDWCRTFGINPYEGVGVLISDSLEKLDIEKNYSIDEIIDSIRKNESAEWHVKGTAEDLFQATKSWGLFSNQGTKIKDIIKAGRVSILDLSVYSTTSGGGWNIKSLVVGIICQKLLADRVTSRKKEEVDIIERGYSYFSNRSDVLDEKRPLVWIVIDEAHEFLGSNEKTFASDALIALLREGRQPGISLVLASQQPGKIHTDVVTQSDIVIAHRITANIDVQALGGLMQSYMREGLDKQLSLLPGEDGAAIVFDDVNEKLYPIRVRPRYTWHGGSAPSALPRVKKVLEF